jgi:hypothetical protein
LVHERRTSRAGRGAREVSIHSHGSGMRIPLMLLRKPELLLDVLGDVLLLLVSGARSSLEGGRRGRAGSVAGVVSARVGGRGRIDGVSIGEDGVRVGMMLVWVRIRVLGLLMLV